MEANNQVTKTQPKPQNAVSLVEQFLNNVVEYAGFSGEVLSEKTKTFAVDIITMSNKMLATSGTTWNNVDIKNSGFISQIKRWSKLGVSSNDHLYIDLRNNSSTGKKDIVIKGQYQTYEKLMRLYFIKKDTIKRFKSDVICVDDKLEKREDFTTGLTELVSHTRNESVDRNKLENIIGAYKIAYVQEGDKLVQYYVEIDKNRIERAMNASSSREKTVWKNDTRKMVLKTVTHEMWNSELIRPFMNFPEDIIEDMTILEETEEMDWNKETKYSNVNDANEEVKTKVASSDDVIDVDYVGD